MPYLHALKIQTIITLGGGVLGAIIQPDYNIHYSFRRNCFHGFETGFIFGWCWTLSIPFLAHKCIKDIVEKDRVLPDWREESMAEKIRMGLFIHKHVFKDESDKKKEEIRKILDSKYPYEKKEMPITEIKEHLHMRKGEDKRRIYDEEVK